MFDRQKRLDPQPAVPKSVLVVGCGGVGSWTALLFAMSGTQTMVLVDPDVLELSNLARLPFTVDDVSQPKVVALASLITRLRPNINAVPIAENFQVVADDKNYIELIKSFEPEVVVDAVDRPSISNMIVRFAKRHLPNAWYVNPNYDGYSFSVMVSKVSKMGSVFADNPPQTYTVAPSFVGTALTPALIAFLTLSVLSRMREDKLYYVHATVFDLLGKVFGNAKTGVS